MRSARMLAEDRRREPSDGPLILSLSEPGDAGAALAGGKAQSLCTLAAAGFPVPEGFALTTHAFRRFVEHAGLSAELHALKQALLPSALMPSNEQLFMARRKVEGAPLPPFLRSALGGAWAEHFTVDVPLAVRSSGTHEDMAGASFAGQYESFLNVRGAEALEMAVKRCWASLWQLRVIDYLRRRGLGSGELGMGVVVQRMIEADVAGVLFTMNPATGREEEAVVEAVFGLGESLVSGKLEPDRFVLDLASGAVRSEQLAAKAFRVVPDGASGVREVPLSASDAERRTLSERALRELAQVGAAIQEHYGRPMDIEFVYADGKLHVVQARPITRITFAAELGDWTTADLRDGGVSSAECSPFMASLYERAFELSMPGYLTSIKLLEPDHRARWMKTFFARPYWNFGEVKRVMERVPGFNERNFDIDLGIEPSYEGQGKTTPVTVGGVARALPVLFALERSYEDVLKRAAAYKASFQERKAPFELEPEDMRRLDRADFVERFRALLERLFVETETLYFTTIYNTSNSKLDFSVAFEKANRAAGETLSYTKLVSGLKNLSHLRPMKDMHQLLGKLHRERRGVDDETARAFAQRWRHRGKKELDLRVPRWGEDLEHVRQLLQEGLASYRPAGDPDAQADKQHREYLAERERALKALSWHVFLRRGFARKLERVRTYAWWREEMRDHSTYVYFLIRRWTLEAGLRLAEEGQLAEQDDVWYLRLEEVQELLDGKLGAPEARRRAREGRRVSRSFRHFEAPNEFGTRYAFVAASAQPPSPGALRGTPCSPGRFEGRARVARTLEEASQVEEGEVLVAVFTDPGWTPLFARIGAVVTETGGLLSHAAVIAREYGIPAVLAVKGATGRIRTGDRVIVDGAQGAIQLAGEGR